MQEESPRVGLIVGVIAGSQVIDTATGPLLEIRFVTALNSIDPGERKQLHGMLNSAEFIAITLEKVQ